MKILFAGTPAFALCPLEKLIAAGDVVAVLTQPDRPQGRHGILTPPPVKVAAERAGRQVLQFESKTDPVEALSKIGADLMVTCAYGKILTQEILDLFPMGVWNLHASLLPAYRGAAPIAHAIMDGCFETGVTVMRTVRELDAGDILMAETCKIENSDTCGTLSEKLSRLSGDMILRAISLLESGNYTLKKQGEGFSCRKVFHTQVDFSLPMKQVCNLIRGLSPSPLAYGTACGQTLNFYMAEEFGCDSDEPHGTILSASYQEGLIVKCGEGAVKITQLQPSGGKVMSARDYLNGRKLQKGQRFEDKSLL